jgi:serine/threonine protein kinase
MQYVENSTLSQYLEFEKPSHDLAAKWILALAHTVSYTHFRHVIIGDIASRNVLLEKDKRVKHCDFSDSGLIPLDVDIEKAEDNGASTSADIFQFCSLVYEILTGQPCKYDLFASEEIERQRKINEATTNREPEATLPQLDRLPATETLALS